MKKNPFKIKWPKKPLYWIDNGVEYISITFTWHLPFVLNQLRRGFRLYKSVIVGGPAVQLIPGYFRELPFVTEGLNFSGVLQKINPMATRTTIGCIRKCKFCGIGQQLIESGGLKELNDWPDLPIICDNNLLAASQKHFDRVIDRLIKWGWADFNQGLDSRLLNEYHCRRLKEIKTPIIRIALDSLKYKDLWERSIDLLNHSRISNSHIRSFALIGFDSGPDEAWKRCEWIESKKIMALPMWFHELDCLSSPIITDKQKQLGWNWHEYRSIMAWYYHHQDLGTRSKYVPTTHRLSPHYPGLRHW